MDTEKRQIHNFRDGDLFADRYRLLARAGSGGFADVWRAEDTLTGKVVALKLYTRLDDESISELAKEYIRMADISHPNLLTGDHFDKVGNIPYLVMRYCSGGSLAGRIGRLSNDELQHIVSDIASGLAYLHSEDIVHQDIKPENILYDSDHDRYLLSDFGISSKSRTRMSKSVNMANMTLSMTEAYAPPEKFSSNPADRMPDPKGDIFSLGITLYELATGELPFEPPMATGREILMQHGQLQLDFAKITDPQLRKYVEHCLCYKKEERFTAAELLKSIESEQTYNTGNSSQQANNSRNTDRGDCRKTERINNSSASRNNATSNIQSEEQAHDGQYKKPPHKIRMSNSIPKSVWFFMLGLLLIVIICLYIGVKDVDTISEMDTSVSYEDANEEKKHNAGYDDYRGHSKVESERNSNGEKNSFDSKKTSKEDGGNRQADINKAAEKVCECGNLGDCPRSVIESSFPEYANDEDFIAAVKKSAEGCIADKVRAAAEEKARELMMEAAKKRIKDSL